MCDFEKIKGGAYIAREFPDVIISMESALYYYGYTDDRPAVWQVVADKNSNHERFEDRMPPVEAFYQDKKYHHLGLVTVRVEDYRVKIFDRDRAICDIVKFQQRLDPVVFENAMIRYMADPKADMQNLFEYAEVLHLTQKVQTQIRKWA
jgi:predicted transcriptional regulator of viral defense system